MIEIRSGDRRAAFEAGRAAYGADAPYVTPMWSDLDRILDPAKNPLSRDGHGRFELFTAHRDGQPVGRIVACLHDASNRRHGTTRGQFGFFDCIDDDAVARALLERAEGWVLERGATEIAGNFNLTAMQMVGVVTGGFEHRPYTDMMWSAPHIARLLGRNGYQPTFPMTTFETDLAAIPDAAIDAPRFKAIEADASLTWHPITRRTFKARFDDGREVLNAAFETNPMFVPVTRDEYAFQAGDMMWILDPRLSVVVHHEGRPAGVVVAIPDLNPLVAAVGGELDWTTPWHFLKHRLTCDRAVIIFYAVTPAMQGRGLVGAMLARLAGAAKKAGYRKLGGTWIADVNAPSLKQLELFGSKPLHRLHLFTKALRRPA